MNGLIYLLRASSLYRSVCLTSVAAMRWLGPIVYWLMSSVVMSKGTQKAAEHLDQWARAPIKSRRLKKCRQRGLTLVELMVTLALLAIFVSLAVPSFASFVQNNKLQGASNELAGLLQFARSFAAEKSASVVVCESSETWTVRRKSTSSDVCGGTELRNFAIPADLTLRSSSSALPITFSSTGTAGSNRAFIICKGSDAANGYKLTIEAGGNVRLLAKGKADVTGIALTSCTP